MRISFYSNKNKNSVDLVDNYSGLKIEEIERQSELINKIQGAYVYFINKQKLIVLYEEEKQTIINQSMTRGIEPNVNLHL